MFLKLRNAAIIPVNIGRLALKLRGKVKVGVCFLIRQGHTCFLLPYSNSGDQFETITQSCCECDSKERVWFMALARPGLEKAINDILERRGVNGKRLSYRQAERLTGLSTATISELAKGNARTSDSLRRFAQGLNEDATRLMLLAGFVPEDVFPLRPPSHGETSPSAESLEPGTDSAADGQETFAYFASLDAEESACLQRLEHALAQIPQGSDRALWKDHLSHCADLLERFVEHRLRV